MSKDESTYPAANRFIAILKKQYARLRHKRLGFSAATFSLIFITGLLLLGFFELQFYLPALTKTSLWILLIIASIATGLYTFRLQPLPSFPKFYRQFSKEYDLPQLTDALDLHLESADQSSLHQAAIRKNIEDLNLEDVKSKLALFLKEQRSHRLYKMSLGASSVIILLFLSFSLWQPGAMQRLAHFWADYSPPNPYLYTIEPGNVTLEQGESLTPKINFEGEVPNNLKLAFKTDIEKEFRERNPSDIEAGEVAFSSISLNTDGQYYFLMDGFKSSEQNISVQLRPRLEMLTVEVIPPEYTRLDTTSYTYPFSQIQAYRGSKINLRAATNKRVEKIKLRKSSIEDSTTTSELTNSDSLQYRYQWQVAQTDTISFSMVDSAGLSNKNEFRFIVDSRNDQPPFANLIAPSENLTIKTPEPIELRYEAGDDFGLTSTSLQFEHQQAFADEAQTGSISLDTPAMNQEQQYEWKIPALNPKPRDIITYWIEVTDNDAVNGYKSGRSQKMTITFPSMTEYMDEVDEQENEVTESLDNISDSFEQMEREYQQFKENLKKNPDTNWEQKEQLQQIDEERNRINEQVEELNKKFEEVRKELENSQAMSPETMKAYDELKNLMEEIDDPELAKALEELQKSLGEMTPDQMRKALEDYEFNEERYKERINRTVELFKSLKLNSDLDKMSKSLEELAQQEQQISESEQSPSEDLEQQKAVQQDLNELEEKLEKLGENGPDKAKQQIEELKNDTRQQMNQTQKELHENMERLKEQQDNSKSDTQTRQQQRDIRKRMQQMAEQMDKAKQQVNQQRRQVNVQGLTYILYSLLNLSTNQEELIKETENLPPRTQAFVEKARKEKNISQQFTMLSDSLFQLSSEIPNFSNQINKKKAEVENQLTRAVEMLSERDKSNSTFAQRQSLGGINELSSMIASLLDQLQDQQGSGSGGQMSMKQMIEEMQKMSGQQQKLNQQIQDMINDIQGDRLNRDQMERLNQLSKQQNRIRKQLKELQQNNELQSGDRVLSELERMSEDMEDAINDLRGGQLDQSLMERQENILSRMLSAEDAIQKRGKEDRREGTTAEEQEQATPPDVTLEELQQRIRKMLNDPNRTEYTEDYQRLIEQYFELLKKQQKEIIGS